MNAGPSRPWYREPWPWLLMAGPALVVVAAIVTLGLALDGNDGLVADDYYKRGLAINQVLARDRVAAAHKYVAGVDFNPGFRRVRVTLTGDETPPALLLNLAHATRAGEDRVVPLAATGQGVYEAPLEPPAAGRWRLTLEDAGRSWRLSADARIPQDTALTLKAR